VTKMESPIKLLDDKTDPATKQILENVVKRKRKFDLYKKRHMVTIWVTISIVSLFFLYLYFTIAANYSYSFAAMFSSFVNDTNNLTFLAATVGMYGYMNLLKGKKEKAEKEFHDLRCEIVDRSKDLWNKEDAWKNRHLVFEMMKKNYDINLYHEKK
jgi:hypothetical protein